MGRLEHVTRILSATRSVHQLLQHEKDPEGLCRELCRLLIQEPGYPSAMIILTDDAGAPRTHFMSGRDDRTFAPMAESLRRGLLPPCCAEARSRGGIVRVEERSRVCAPCPLAAQCSLHSHFCVPMRHENLRGYVVVAVDPVAGLGDDDETFLTDMADSTIFALHGLRQGTDICESEEKRGVLQGQFQQSQKMEVVGRLAGGVAHDFNNLLTVILGSCDFLLRDLPADDPGRLDVEQIRSTGERAANLTRQLLAFSRKQILQPTTLDLNAVLTNTEKLLRRLIGEDVALSVCYGQDMSLIKADQGQLEQVVMNLAVNARDAMPKGGRLAIETRDLRLSDAQTLMRDVAVPPGRYALLTVEDTGTGMSPETLEHVFEPFFTTKGLGKGTGLGLATVYGVIKQSGGFIDIQSGLGRGTTFKIFLPVAPDSDLKAAPERADGRPEERPAGASRNTILLVEDETTVRRLIRRILVNAGYAVLEAASAQEALELSGKDFDLVLTDIVLPDVSGVELTAKLQKMRPIQALYMSGYTESPNILDILAQPGNRFLQKPFTTKALLDMIQDILAKNPAP